MSQRLKKLILLFVVVAAVIVAGWFWRHHNTHKQGTTFRVGIATWPGFAPGYIAKANGYFGSLDVNFSILDDFSARQNAFTSNATDATIYTIDSLAFDAGHGIQGKGVTILDESYGADAIVAGPRIHSAEDLKGKRIAYTRGSPSEFFLIEFLQKHSMSLNDIQRVEVDDPGRAGEALVSGSVDAAVTWEPNISQIVQSGKGRILESTRTTPGLIVDIMVVSPRAYEQRKKDIQTFVSGWLKAVDYIKEHPDTSYPVMAQNLKIPVADFPKMMQGLQLADINRNRALLLPPENSKAVLIFDEATKVWMDQKLISTPQRGKDFIASEFIQNIK
jgi:NitT/TauT family transport system substrate-binding protein